MNEKIRNWSVGLVIIGILFLSGCVTLSPVPPLSPPQFSFEMPSEGIKKSDIVVGIVAPSYNPEILMFPVMLNKDKEIIKNIVETFTRSISTDFEKILIAKGFKIIGPFPNLNEMTYPERKGCNLVILPQIFITTNYSSQGIGSQFFPAGTGTITLSGFMKIEIIEPLSYEKMWIKKINFESVLEDYQFSYYYSPSDNMNHVQIDTRPHALQRALERSYPKTMDTVLKYLNFEEIDGLRKEAEKLREKKRY